MRVSSTGVGGPKRLWHLHSGEFQNLTEQGPGGPDPTLSKNLIYFTSRDRFQPTFFFDSLFSRAFL